MRSRANSHFVYARHAPTHRPVMRLAWLDRSRPAISDVMPAAQQALTLLSRWPSAAAGASSAIRGAACLLGQPAAHTAVEPHSGQWGCLPAPQMPQHSGGAGLDPRDARRPARCSPPRSSAELVSDEPRSTAFCTTPSVPWPLQPWVASAPRRTLLQPRTRQQVRIAIIFIP